MFGLLPAELFQWRGEVKPGLPEFTAEERVRVGEELSDVLMYLVRLADKCDIDLPAAVAGMQFNQSTV
jgi:dCTP diphosphatase